MKVWVRRLAWCSVIAALGILGACNTDPAVRVTPIPLPSPSATGSPPAPSPVAAPTAVPTRAVPDAPDVLALLPPGNQPLAVVQADLDGDGRVEWVVLAGKVGQPAFETVVPLVLAAGPEAWSIVWRGQVDFSVEASGLLQVADLTGDGRPEILYQNKSKVGGVYAFLYGGSAQVGEHPRLRPEGGVCAGLDFFCGWTLEVGPPDPAGLRPLVVLADRSGARQLYRWNGNAFAAAETVRGTPWPGDRPTPPVAARPDPATFDVAGGEGGSTVLDRLEADLDGDKVLEIAVVYQPLAVQSLTLAIFAWGGAPGQGETYRVVWRADAMAGTENQVLRARDLTADGRPELLNGQGGGVTGGGTLYVVGYGPGGYTLLRPQGGPQAGQDSFGSGDYEVREQGGGRPPHIWAWRAADAAPDIYVWRDGAFQYQAATP